VACGEDDAVVVDEEPTGSSDAPGTAPRAGEAALLAPEDLGPGWQEGSSPSTTGGSALAPPCGPGDAFEDLAGAVEGIELESPGDGLGLLHLLATLDPDGLDVVLDAWSSLDCTAEGLEVERLDTGDVPGDRAVGATVRTGDAFDLQLVQAVVVAQQGAAVSVVVVTGPSDQVAAVALEASTTALS
jgi:hypothetical protein